VRKGLWFAAVIAAVALMTTPALSASGLLTNLVAYWRLDEASGVRYDAHASYDLTETNTVGSTTGLRGSAAQFVAAQMEYLSYPPGSTLALGDENVTIAAWLRLNSAGAQPVIRQAGVFALDVTSSSAIQFSYGGYTVTSAPVLTGTWYHVVARHDSVNDTLHLTLNSTSTTTASSGSVVSNTNALYIGTDTMNYLNGALDEVGIWRRVLSASEIDTLYNDGAGISYPFADHIVYLPAIYNGWPPFAWPDTPEAGQPFVINPLSYTEDTTWWDWAQQIAAMSNPLFSIIGDALDALDEVLSDMCGVDDDLGAYLAGHSYDTLVELQLGDDPSVQEISYSLGLALGRPIGWARGALRWYRDIDALYLQAFVMFLLAGIVWFVFVTNFMYIVRIARWLVDIVSWVYDKIPFKFT